MNRKSLFIAFLVAARILSGLIFLLYLVVIQQQEMFPAMRDQFEYLYDIRAIFSDFNFLFLSDYHYFSNNTLYSRLVGFFGVLFFLQDAEPIVSAVLVNTFCQILLSFSLFFFYRRAGGKFDLLLFATVLFSPTISAYTFFALRDVMIATFFTLFLLFLFRNRFLVASVLALLTVLLRPLFLSYVSYVSALFIIFHSYQKAKQKKIFIVISIALAAIIAQGIIIAMDYEWVYNRLLSPNFSFVYLFSSSLGYGAFVGTGSEATMIDADVSRTVRIVMFDSLIVPAVSIASSFYLLLRGRLFEKRIAFILIIATISLALSYVIVQGNYPMRKILPIFPLMYLPAFFAFTRISTLRSAKLNRQQVRYS